MPRYNSTPKRHGTGAMDAAAIARGLEEYATPLAEFPFNHAALDLPVLPPTGAPAPLRALLPHRRTILVLGRNLL